MNDNERARPELATHCSGNSSLTSATAIVIAIVVFGAMPAVVAWPGFIPRLHSLPVEQVTAGVVLFELLRWGMPFFLLVGFCEPEDRLGTWVTRIAGALMLFLPIALLGLVYGQARGSTPLAYVAGLVFASLPVFLPAALANLRRAWGARHG